jgi:homoserine trans-succinylase
MAIDRDNQHVMTIAKAVVSITVAICWATADALAAMIAATTKRRAKLSGNRLVIHLS